MSVILEISQLKPFFKNPFRKLEGEKLKQLAESIAQCGLITPILVRPISHPIYSYEVVAGHNRIDAVLLNGQSKIEAEVRELSDDLATIMLVDSNLQQREHIMPSEKAWAYRAKMNAIARQGRRADLISRQVGTKLENKRSDQVLAANSPDSARNIQRYIRLTYLIQPLLNLVDDGRFKFNPAVEVSYLSDEKQSDLYERMQYHDCYNISLDSARRIKEISKYGVLSVEKIDLFCFNEKDSLSKGNIKIPANRVNSYFDPDMSPREKEDIIVKALELYFRQIGKTHRIHENAFKERA